MSEKENKSTCLSCISVDVVKIYEHVIIFMTTMNMAHLQEQMEACEVRYFDVKWYT